MMRLRRHLLIAMLVVITSALGLRLSTATAAGTLQTIVTPGGQPDDVVLDGHGRLVWGDLTRGTVNRLQHGRITVLARGLEAPEGIVTLPDGTLVVAEQGQDRIVHLRAHGKRHTVMSLRPVAGQEGVDGIGWDAHARALLVPDSPNGTILRIGVNGRHRHVLARGLGRPVDAAIDRHGNILAPDEHLGAVIVISPHGAVNRIGPFATPDDVAVDHAGTIWITTLGDNALWEVRPHATPALVLGGLGNPQGLTLDRCGNPIVVEQTGARIVRLLLHPCRLASLGR